MQAGRMKERLELLRPERTTGGFGDEAVSYTPVATVHAERVKYTARRSEEAAEHCREHELQVPEISDDGTHHTCKCMRP